MINKQLEHVQILSWQNFDPTSDSKIFSELIKDVSIEHGYYLSFADHKDNRFQSISVAYVEW